VPSLYAWLPGRREKIEEGRKKERKWRERGDEKQMTRDRRSRQEKKLRARAKNKK
jgi:hypothetical protein